MEEEWSGMEWERSGNPPSIYTYGHPTEVGAPTGACFESYGRGAWFDLFFHFESRCREIVPSSQ